MRVAVISDLHVGPEAGRDGFGHDERTFLRFLDRLERDHDRIVLLGDVYQTDHGVWPDARSTARHLHRARARTPELTRRFATAKYSYVHGNHDAIAGRELAAPDHLVLEARVRAAFVHGHQFDPVAVRVPVAAHAGTWICGRLRAVGLARVAALVEARDVAIKDRRFAGDDGPYARGARSVASAHRAEIVVMGHTHVPLVSTLPGVVLVNDGTCSGGTFMHASLDLAAGEVAVHHPGGTMRTQVV